MTLLHQKNEHKCHNESESAFDTLDVAKEESEEQPERVFHNEITIVVNAIVHGGSRVALKHGPLVKIPTTKAFNFKFGTHTQ